MRDFEKKYEERKMVISEGLRKKRADRVGGGGSVEGRKGAKSKFLL